MKAPVEQTSPHAHLSGPNTPETPIDIDMTADELIELSANQPLPAHGAVRSRQLDLREGNLNRREQAMTMRQTILARREVDFIARETRVDELYVYSSSALMRAELEYTYKSFVDSFEFKKA